MPTVRIELKKGRGGPDSLAIVRGDGSRTWERVQREVRELATRWRAFAAGKTLSLELDVGACRAT